MRTIRIGFRHCILALLTFETPEVRPERARDPQTLGFTYNKTGKVSPCALVVLPDQHQQCKAKPYTERVREKVT